MIARAFFTALVALAIYVADPQSKLPSIVYWTLGSFAGADKAKVVSLGVPLLIAGTVVRGLRWRLNLLSLADADARSLGLKVSPLRWLVVTLVGAIVAAQVAVSGGIGWVGLVVPHVARMVVGAEHRRLIPVATSMGAIFLLAVDDVARSVPAHELPIGLLTALFGTPLFAVILWRMKARGWKQD